VEVLRCTGRACGPELARCWGVAYALWNCAWLVLLEGLRQAWGVEEEESLSREVEGLGWSIKGFCTRCRAVPGCLGLRA